MLIIEPDSLPNLATNQADPHCGNSATIAAYQSGIAYAVNRFKSLSVTMYLDGAHGGWLGWENNLQQYTSLVLQVLGSNILALRGFSTNVANYQPIGIMCPFQSSDGIRNDYCLNGQHQSDPCCADPCALESQYNSGNNELNYANILFHAFQAVQPSFIPHFVIDSGRNGVSNMRSSCSNWCNIRGAGIGVPPTANTAVPSLVDAYYWLKTPGESDGCTQILPDGSTCPRFDSLCASADSLGSNAGEPRAPQAGKWFDYEIKQLASNSALTNYSSILSNSPASAPSPSAAYFSPSAAPVYIPNGPQPTRIPAQLPPSNINSNLICLYGGYCRTNSDCVPGAECNSQSQYYSQCVPDSSQYLNPSTGCLSDYGAECNSASVCCNPGSVCNINSAFPQCGALQPPQCSLPSGFNVGPPPTLGPSSSVIPTLSPSSRPSAPSLQPSATPSQPTSVVTILPSKFPSIVSSSGPTTTNAPNTIATKVLSTNGNQIVNSNGSPVRLTGVNW